MVSLCFICDRWICTDLDEMLISYIQCLATWLARAKDSWKWCSRGFKVCRIKNVTSYVCTQMGYPSGHSSTKGHPFLCQTTGRQKKRYILVCSLCPALLVWCMGGRSESEKEAECESRSRKRPSSNPSWCQIPSYLLRMATSTTIR